jgi:hypothetical protein
MANGASAPIRVEVNGPTPQSKPSHVGTVVIEHDGNKLSVLCHRPGWYRLRFNQAPMEITEAYLTGDKTIVSVRPAVHECPFPGCSTVAKTEKGFREHLEAKHGAA